MCVCLESTLCDVGFMVFCLGPSRYFRKRPSGRTPFLFFCVLAELKPSSLSTQQPPCGTSTNASNYEVLGKLKPCTLNPACFPSWINNQNLQPYVSKYCVFNVLTPACSVRVHLACSVLRRKPLQRLQAYSFNRPTFRANLNPKSHQPLVT